MGWRPVSSVATDGRVHGLWVKARLKRTPRCASRSRFGVTSRLLTPFAPRASQRQVSITTRMTSGLDVFSGCSVRGPQAHAKARQTRAILHTAAFTVGSLAAGNETVSSESGVRSTGALYSVLKTSVSTERCPIQHLLGAISRLSKVHKSRDSSFLMRVDTGPVGSRGGPAAAC